MRTELLKESSFLRGELHLSRGTTSVGFGNDARWPRLFRVPEVSSLTLRWRGLSLR